MIFQPTSTSDYYTWTFTRFWYCPLREGHFIKLQACFKSRKDDSPRERTQVVFYKASIMYSIPSWVPVKLAFLNGTVEENLQSAALKAGYPNKYALLRAVKESGDLDIPLSVGVSEPPRPTLFEHLVSDP